MGLKLLRIILAITDQYRWRALFSNAYGQYASRITGHILFHSVPYTASLEDKLITQTYNKCGTYIVEYSAVGEIGTTAKVQATVTVVSTEE